MEPISPILRTPVFPTCRISNRFFSKNKKTGLLCFGLSAVLHELVLAVPLGSFRMPIAFAAMMGQVPLVRVSVWIDRRTRRTPFAQLGNYLFWISFCFLGQPAAVLLYYDLLASSRVSNKYT